jgi:hypothetical protein
MKLISVKKSTNPKFKYTATFQLDNGKTKTTNFGASGYSDYLIHKDVNRRTRYRSRHEKDLKTNDPTRAGYLSMGILWNEPTLKASIEEYTKLLNQYNKDKNIEKFKKALLT